jgi:hypothetical protein
MAKKLTTFYSKPQNYPFGFTGILAAIRIACSCPFRAIFLAAFISAWNSLLHDVQRNAERFTLLRLSIVLQI